MKNLKTISFFKKPLLFIALVLLTKNSTAQLTGVKNIPSDYATVALFVTDINSVGVGAGGVIVNIAAGYTETNATSLGLSLTATGTAANPITIQKSGAGANPIITAGIGGTGTPGSAVQDGIFSLIGSDYVTIDGIDLQENAANTTNPSTMEFGYGLFKASVTNGCQYNTIKNCSIILSLVNNAAGTAPAFDGSRGINMVNSLITTQTTALTITNSTGSNSFNTFIANTVKNVNIGFALSGFAATVGVGPAPNSATFFGDMNNAVGSTFFLNGNIIHNFGGAAAAVNPAAGIRTVNQWSPLISNNALNNNIGSGGGANHVSTLRGILIGSSTSASTDINNNNITLVSGATTSLLEGISSSTGSTALVNTVNINSNVLNVAYSTATTGTINGIANTGTPATLNINSNTITNVASLPVLQNVIGGTGTVIFISGGSPTALTINNNLISTFARTSIATGTTRGIVITSPTNTTITGNTIENIAYSTPTSTGSFDGIYGNSSSVNVTASNNIIRNISTPTTGTINGIREFGVAGIKTINNNQIYGFATTTGGAGGASFNGILCLTGTVTAQGNQIYNLVSTGSTGGTTGAINGISIGGGTASSILNNKIYDLSSNSTGPVVSGILFSSGTTNTATNNLIGDLRAPFANATNAVIGINVTGGTTDLIYYNTVNLAATSSGVNFGSSAISASTTPNLTMNNNIFVNNSTANGTGLTVAYRRSSTTLTSYQTTSNRNDFFASTIYTDGTTSQVTLAGYQAAMATRDGNSINEAPNFLSTVGSTLNFLHINTTLPSAIESGGSNIGGITTDFDADIRQGNAGYVGTGTAPDMGADEFETALVTCSSANGGTISPNTNTNCQGTTRTITSVGASNQFGNTYQWKVSTTAGGPYVNVTGGSGATATAYTTGLLTPGTFYYVLETTCSFGGLTGLSNEYTLVVNPTPIIVVTPSSAIYCNPGTAVALTASGASAFAWSPATGLSAVTGVNVNASPSATTTYSVIGSELGCPSLPVTATITVVSIPVIASVTATPATVCNIGNSQLTNSTTAAYNQTVSAYSFAGASGAYLPITGTASTAIGDDATQGSLPIGFTFNYNGSTFTQFAINSNGGIQLNSASFSILTNSLATNANCIMPLWDDNNSTGGTIIYSTTGISPNQVLTVQWTGLHVGGNGNGANPTIDMQLKLYETTGVVELIYGNTSAALLSTSASIGISGAVGNYLSLTPLSPVNTSTVSSTSENSTIASATNFPSGTIYTFTPPATPIINYSWSPATFLSSTTISNPIATGLNTTTTYTLTATTSGCAANANVTITSNPLPSAPTGTNSAQCGTQIPTVTVASTSGLPTPTFVWYDAAVAGNVMQSSTFTTYTSNVAATITFYVCELNTLTGCESARTPVTVTVASADGISANSSLSTICIGSSITLTAANTNPTPNQSYTYTWSGVAGSGASVPVGGNPAVITPTVAGTYTYDVNGVDGLCNAFAQVTVTVNPFVAAISAIDATCNGVANGSFSLTSTTCGTAPFTYSLDGGAYGPISTTIAAGAHTVIVKDANGFLSATLPLTITQPSTTITNPVGTNVAVCQNDASALVAATATTSVQIPGSLTVSFTVLAQPTETNTAPGNIVSSAAYSLPAGATITGATIDYNGLTALASSWMSDIRLGLSGNVTDAATQGTGSTNAAGTFNYTRPIPAGSFAGISGTANLLYWDFFNDNAGAEATFTTGAAAATLTINYTVPTPATISWWDAATNGTQIGTGSPFQVVGTSVLPTTATPGVYTVYAQGQNGACPSPGRTAVLVTVKAKSFNTIAASSCVSFTLNGTTYNASGTYNQTLVNAVGCDSILTLNLTIKVPTTSSTPITACNSYTWTNGTTYSASGSYTQLLTNAAGCDSTATLVLTIKNSTTSTTDVNACSSYDWTNGTTYTLTGTYTQTLVNAVGCDSVATLNLTINLPTSSSLTQTACDSYTLNGSTYTTSGTYVQTTTNAAGCDSTITLNLTIKNSTTSSTAITTCDSYTWTNGVTYFASGTHTQVLTNAVGCDSTATLNLIIKNSTTSTTTITACSSYTWTNGVTYFASTTASQLLVNAAGCDSTATLNLTINQPTSGMDMIVACDTYTWPANGVTYAASGMAMATLTNAAGCDSVVTLMLTINNSTTSTMNATACDTYTLNGTTYNASGTFVQVIANAAGCDSTITLNLTINNSTTSTTTVSQCDAYTWTNGTTYNASGTFSQLLTNAAGCDSTATLVLTITGTTATATDNGDATITASAGASYQWMDCATNTNLAGETSQTLTVTANGSYKVIVTNAAGCVDTSTCVVINYIGINETSSNAISVYPNPTREFVTVTISTGTASIEVFDAQGKLLQTTTIDKSGTVNLSAYETGMYIFKIKTDSGTTIHRIAKN